MFPAINTATTNAYTAMIPDMTTGIKDCRQMSDTPLSELFESNGWISVPSL